jgi:hypothetical protein
VTTVRAFQRLTILSQWTVQGVAGSTGVVFNETLDYPTGAGWRPLGAPLQNAFDTTDGTHSFRFTFVPSGAYNALRIVVGLTIGNHTQERGVTVQVRR